MTNDAFNWRISSRVERENEGGRERERRALTQRHTSMKMECLRKTKEQIRGRERGSERVVGWTRMRQIMRHFFYPPALCVCSITMIRLFSPGPHYQCTWTRANNEFIEIEKCRGLNCMYLVTQTEAMAWEWLVSQWHHLSFGVDSMDP